MKFDESWFQQRPTGSINFKEYKYLSDRIKIKYNPINDDYFAYTKDVELNVTKFEQLSTHGKVTVTELAAYYKCVLKFEMKYLSDFLRELEWFRGVKQRELS